MGAPRKYNRSEPPQNPLAGMSIKQLYREAKHLYHLYAAAADHLDERIRLTMAGEQRDLRKLDNYAQQRETHLAKLRPILQEIAARARAAGRTPDYDIEDGLGYLTTRAQAIARAATTNNFQI